MPCKFVALLLGFCATAVLAVEPVSELKLVPYMGRWYQVITNGFARSVSQPNSTCNTVEYGVESETRIVEDNRFRKDTPNGELDRTTGFADLTDRPGVLMIKFDNIAQSFEYSVFALGTEMTELGQYPWALVTDSGERSLYGLIRDKGAYKGTIKEAMLAAVQAAGFTEEMSKPMDVYHGSDCIYPESFDPMVLVTALDPAMMPGNYFMMYTNKNTRDVMFPDNYCTTFQLTANDDGTVSLKIAYAEGSAKGSKKTAMAKVSTTGEVGVLSAMFDGADAATTLAVIKTGPVVDGKYSYLVITDALKSALHVIALDPEEFNKKYKDDVMDFLEKSGFNGLVTTPLEQTQGGDCSYPDGFEVGGAAQLASLSMAGLLAISFLRYLL